MDYERSQQGWFAIPVLVLLGVVAWATSSAEDMSSTGTAVFTVLMVVVLVAMVTFSRLTVTVGAGRVTARFWLGWPRRVVELSEVTAVRAVRNSWWYGWGVRKVPGGWMYNVWGYDAIELELTSGKVFRIGTDDPDGLVAALADRKVS